MRPSLQLESFFQMSVLCTNSSDVMGASPTFTHIAQVHFTSFSQGVGQHITLVNIYLVL